MSISRVILSAAILSLAASCGGSSTPTTPTTPTPPSGVGVSIQVGARALGNQAFAPNPATVPVGTTVTWTNNDTATHSVTSDTGAFDSGSLAPGAKFSFTFQTRATFPYHCSPHPTMVATVVVQ